METSQLEISLGDYLYNDRYCLGQGSFGKVYKGRHGHTNLQVAIKEIDSRSMTHDEIIKEITILKQLKHPNIVEYYDAFENNGYFYIVTEYCAGGDLRAVLEESSAEESEDEGETTTQFKQVQQMDNEWMENETVVTGHGQSVTKHSRRTSKLPLPETLNMFFQICSGFSYLQSRNIIHRDLKPSNILLHNGIYKIADFGLAKTESVYRSIMYFFTYISQQELMGVPIYMSPQILSKNYYTYKCDVWSLGIIIHEIVFGEVPWKVKEADQLFFDIMSDPEPYVRRKGVNVVVREILKGTLRYLESDRMDWEKLIELRSLVEGKGEKELVQNEINNMPKPSKKLFFPPTHPSISTEESEILHHILGLINGLSTELEPLSEPQHLHSLLMTIDRYIYEGVVYQGGNLHVQLMEYDCLEDARQLLLLLELMHDYVVEGRRKEGRGKDGRMKEGMLTKSFRNERIAEFAASVISKINTTFHFQKDKNLQ